MPDSVGEITITTPEGDKILKVDEIKGLLDQNKDLSGKVAGMTNVSKAIERYGTDADTYLSNAEAAFGIMTELIGKGVIDEQGNLLEKGKGGDASGGKKNDSFSDFDGQDDKFKTDRVAQVVAKVVETKLGGLMKQVEELTSGQAGLYRAQLKSAVQGKYPSFSDEDVSKLFGVASTNPSKDLWGHAEELAKGKKVNEQSDRAKFAKEFGVDIKAFDENKLREQSADGGAVAMFPGKKFVFSPRAKRLGDKDAISPREAMQQHMAANLKRR